jgi:hypothetical protein
MIGLLTALIDHPELLTIKDNDGEEAWGNSAWPWAMRRTRS